MKKYILELIITVLLWGAGAHNAFFETTATVDGLVNNLPFEGISAESSYHAASIVNYFEVYASVYEQKRMLQDNVRMDAYFSAFQKNKHMFTGKIVLDIGTGSSGNNSVILPSNYIKP